MNGLTLDAPPADSKMNLRALRNPEYWQRHIAIRQKRLTQALRRACETRPVFVLGKQRSGTSMLMHAFHRHSDTLVLDEHRDNEAFDNYRLRSFDVIHQLIDRTRFPTVCMKPVSDSHRIADMYNAFPDGHFIWIYRDYPDVANSSLRKFSAATHAIRLVCLNKPGGGWFQDGVSPPVSRALQDVYRPTLTDFDLACLAWWTRNQIIIESGLIGKANVTILNYEALVSEPQEMFRWLFDQIGMEYRDRVARNISPRSVGRHAVPELDNRVRDMCAATMAVLDDAFLASDPPHRVESRST